MLLPSWVALVRQANASCHVGDVGDTSTAGIGVSAVCATAQLELCECFEPPKRAEPGSHRGDADGATAMAVRWRCVYRIGELIPRY